MKSTEPIRYVTLLLALATAVPAWPEESAPVATSAPSTQLDEVVVTAQRRNENLQKVPVSIAVAPASVLEAKGITSVADLSGLTPGLISTAAEGFALPFIRGIGTSSDSAGVSSPIAIYVDGVYIDSPVASLFSMNNIAQVEVDKGPQGTLFGRNATGGVIQITTKEPSQAFAGKVAVSSDNYRKVVTDAYVAGGIASNLAADLAIRYSDQAEGWGRNLYTGQDQYKGRELDLRTKWVWTPTDNDKITLIVDHENQNDTFGVLDYINGFKPYDYGLSAIEAKTGNPYNSYANVNSPHTMQETGVSAKVEHEFDLASLTNITAYRFTKEASTFDFSLPPANIAGLLASEYGQWTEEVQLASLSASKVRWVTGVFFMHSSSSDDPDENGQAGTPAFPGGLFGFPPLPAGTAPTIHPPNNFGTVTSSTQTTGSAALFGQATTEVLERTNLTVGVRYTHENASIYGYTGGVVVPGHSASFSKPTWRLALDHHLSDALMAYVSYNRGFLAGTFNDDTPLANATLPETLDAYAAGLKSEYFDGRLRVNAEGFFYNYKNIVEPVAVVANGVVVETTVNGPAAQAYGLDLDVVAELTDRLRVSVGLEALHSEFTQYSGAQLFEPGIAGPCYASLPTLSGSNTLVTAPAAGVAGCYTNKGATGNQLPFAPIFTSDLTASYRLPTSAGDFNFSGTWDHDSGWFTGSENELKQKSYEMVSAQIAWDLPKTKLRVALFGRNLTDSLVYARGITTSPFGYLVTYQAPRTYGARAEYAF